MRNADLACKKEGRRKQIRKEATSEEGLNGIDYVEVVIKPKSSNSDPIKDVYLEVHLFKNIKNSIARENIIIEGGRRIRDVSVQESNPLGRKNDKVFKGFQIKLNKLGDFSQYTLRLVEVDVIKQPTDTPLKGFDPRYAQIDFSFRQGCSSDLDCKQKLICPTDRKEEPEINYLAKDYASFRQLILDRLSLVMPDWKERHVPDIGIALTEILAYTGDYLSYYQDAVATEAYLMTARQRISVRRHARLVDYIMHDGCNARAYVFVKTADNIDLDSREIFFISRKDDLARTSKAVIAREELIGVPENSYEVFQPIVEINEEPLNIENVNFSEDIIIKLREAEDPISQCIFKELSSDLQEQLKKFIPGSIIDEKIIAKLIQDLNRLIHLEILSRSLLEEIYPGQITGKMISLYKAHNEIPFYTWGNTECCLAKGATSAFLRDKWRNLPITNAAGGSPPLEEQQFNQLFQLFNFSPKNTHPEEQLKVDLDKLTKPEFRSLELKVGDILIFEEVADPKTGNRADRDIAHRQAVRLTKVELNYDPLLTTPEIVKKDKTETTIDIPTPVVDIEWDLEDALLFPLCISAIGPAPVCQLNEAISVARGNVILVEHGREVKEELGSVLVEEITGKCDCDYLPAETSRLPRRFRPKLSKAPLTFSQPLPINGSAKRFLEQDPRQAEPQIKLVGIPSRCSLDSLEWTSRSDLLSSESEDRHFVAEIDDDGQGILRFGDGDLGKMPDAGTYFSAIYRIGTGHSGNVGAESISCMVFKRNMKKGLVSEVRNPLPSQGGMDPESIQEVKLFAPGRFRQDLQRAIAADDYARLAERNPRVQRAAAIFHWMGGWYEVNVAVDPRGTDEASPDLLSEVKNYLEPFHRMGYDLRVVPVQYIPIEIDMTIVVKSEYLKGHVKAAMQDLFSSRLLPDGNMGYFHPDNLSFGVSIFLSKLAAAAQFVTGVENVCITKLQRLGSGPDHEMEKGVLEIGPLEIAQMNNDPNFPEKGILNLDIRGGR